MRYAYKDNGLILYTYLFRFDQDTFSHRLTNLLSNKQIEDLFLSKFFALDALNILEIL